ncbi:hypothetical protein SprV_0100454600 [Sparganum proliferum]
MLKAPLSQGHSPSQQVVPDKLTCSHPTDFNSDARASTEPQLAMRHLKSPLPATSTTSHWDTTPRQMQYTPIGNHLNLAHKPAKAAATTVSLTLTHDWTQSTPALASPAATAA